MRRIQLPVAALCFFLHAFSLTSGANLVVDLNGGGDFTDIQSALDAASDGDTVLVKPGLYLVSSVRFNPITFRDDGSPPPRDIALVSEAGPEKTIIANADPEQYNWSLVWIHGGETRRTVLRGFTITGGGGRFAEGCGIQIRGSPVIENCIITRNQSAMHTSGGGITISSGSDVLIRNCRIERNFILDDGEGAGIMCNVSRATFVNCEIINNVCHSDSRAAGAHIYKSEVRFINCLFAGNRSDSGYTIMAVRSSSLRMINCTIAGNEHFICFGMRGVPWSGFARRYAGIGGFTGSYVELINCILWDNGHYTLVPSPEATIVLDHCLLDPEEIYHSPFGEKIVWREGNICANPLFVNSEWGDYGLRPCSPCIDAGVVVDDAGQQDLAGNSRQCRSGIDIGAYEYCGEQEPFTLVQFKRGDTNGDGIINVADAVAVYMFGWGKLDLACPDAGDVDDDGWIGGSDCLELLTRIFTGKTRESYGLSCMPLPTRCTVDLTADIYDCYEYEACNYQIAK